MCLPHRQIARSHSVYTETPYPQRTVVLHSSHGTIVLDFHQRAYLRYMRDITEQDRNRLPELVLRTPVESGDPIVRIWQVKSRMPVSASQIRRIRSLAALARYLPSGKGPGYTPDVVCLPMVAIAICPPAALPHLEVWPGCVEARKRLPGCQAACRLSCRSLPDAAS